MAIYDDFLRYIGYEEPEISDTLPLWREVCAKLTIDEATLRAAMDEWMPSYWDMSLAGIRKCIQAYFREFLAIFKLPEYQRSGHPVIYTNMPCHPAAIYANKIAGDGKLHVSNPEWVLASVMRAFFHKDIQPVNGSALCMNPLCHHCGMNSTVVEALVNGIITIPTVFWNWGLFCDESPKTEEFLKAQLGKDWHYVITTAPHDSIAGQNEAEDKPRVDYLARQIRSGQESISSYTGINVSDDDVGEALRQYMAYLDKLHTLSQMVLHSDPQPITGNDLTLFIAPMTVSLEFGFKYLGEAIDIMISDVEARIANGEGPLPAGSPKIACHFIPFSVPWICKAFLENGINLSTNTFFAPAWLQKKYYDKADAYGSISRQWLTTPSAINMQNEARIVIDILENSEDDAVLYGFFDFDRWIGGLQKTMIQIVEKQTRIPHYYLEGDFWSDTKYDRASREKRIQNIAYSVKLNKMLGL